MQYLTEKYNTARLSNNENGSADEFALQITIMAD